MKLYQKRIKNDDFEQVEECHKCKKLFWAKSEYELGNWENFCKFCEKENKKELKLNEDNIKKNGKAVYGANGQIKGWELDVEKVLNSEYQMSEKEIEMQANGFMLWNKS